MWIVFIALVGVPGGAADTPYLRRGITEVFSGRFSKKKKGEINLLQATTA